MSNSIRLISALIQTGSLSGIKDELNKIGIENINMFDNDGYSLLQQTAIHGKAAIATYLIAQGAKISTSNTYPDADILAEQHGHQDLANYLTMAKKTQTYPIENRRGPRFGRTP